LAPPLLLLEGKAREVQNGYAQSIWAGRLKTRGSVEKAGWSEMQGCS